MQIDGIMADAAVLDELGRRLERHRLERNWTQAQLATEAGIGQATVQRAERGRSVQMTSMVKLLRALGLLADLDAAIPEAIELPIARLEREQRLTRRRARGRRGRGKDNDNDSGSGDRDAPSAGSDAEPWRWGGEPKADA